MSPSPTVRLVSVCVGKVGGWNLPCAAVEREVSRSLSANGAKRLRHLSPSYTRVRAPTHTHTHTYTKFPLLFSLSILQLLFISFVFSFLLPPSPVPTFIHSCFLFNIITVVLQLLFLWNSFILRHFRPTIPIGSYAPATSNCFGYNRVDLWHPALFLPSLAS